MKKWILVCAALGFSQGVSRTDLTNEEKLAVIDYNSKAINAIKAVQLAQAKESAVAAEWKAYFESLQKAHGAVGCDMDRNTMRWESCRSIIEKKK